jgi:large subunit ribosomal protein L24
VAPAARPQAAPLPPAIDVKPAPGTAAKPKPPLALTPQVANPPPRPAVPAPN